ncbi:iron-containing redox enzyme family protein [Piscinibacter koreensis]|uniref:Iron-containing redox enzyme family protein n=1 Tax=Piscinibacter koreensis TaxID=2742824 RepID=A0A7Y6NLM8_9BURK|nr:iron-containing redox enzyme family protein [Schlegelella koreensis]NUZ05409.1 iron-containing redox enzyme family protein [Schlegelella koreensis]
MLQVVSPRREPAPTPELNPRRGRAESIYHALLREHGGTPGQIDELARAASRSWLADRLEAAADLESDLPDDPRALADWLEEGNRRVGAQYREYLAERQAGAPRRYFSCRSHALHFLRGVAPTKLVDGAWLYGLLGRAEDPDYAALIRIYLEELGEGSPDKNHVVLYRKLLDANGCEHFADQLRDEHYVQGALQLSLAHHAADFLPEVIGFNLGYEQLPLHLLISAYELSELGIDPYYFTLHVTVDNAATGHARKAVDGLLNALPRLADPRAFYRRVAAGYKLNGLGAGTTDVIEGFDLERELVAVLADKAAIGAALHSDYCRIGGRLVSDWLSEPGSLPAFLAALESNGWIRRGQDPQNSRFWQLIQSERAPMFGVFNRYEQQLIHDWIVAEPREQAGAGERRTPRRFRPPPAAAAPGSVSAGVPPRARSLVEVVRRETAGDADDFDGERAALRERLLAAPDRRAAMATARELMSPANHHSAVGLAATRVFSRLFDEAC